ncbi:hypothetical protein MAR_034375, partial [Mya arenaria]
MVNLVIRKYCCYPGKTPLASSCDRCQRAKGDPTASPTLSNPLPIRFHIDLIGPTTKKFEWAFSFLVCVCNPTRWVEVFPIRAQSASEFAGVLHGEIFWRYGASNVIVTMQFVRFTAGYNPQASGCVERQNATVIKTIKN